MASEMYWVPEHDAGVAVLCNQEYQEYCKELAKRALRRLLEINGASLEPDAAPLADAPVIDVSPGHLDRFVGVYGGILRGAAVKVTQGKLCLEYSGKDVELSPRSETVFSAEEPKAVVFGLDGQGKPTHLKVHSSGGVITHMDYLGRLPEEPGTDRGEWGGFVGLYKMSLYAIEAFFGAVKLEDDGYLHLRLWGDQRLYEHEGHPNLFFTFKGEAVVFGRDHLLFDNIMCRRIDDPEVFIKEFEASRRSKLPDWIIDQAVGMLKYLGRDGEAKSVMQLKRR